MRCSLKRRNEQVKNAQGSRLSGIARKCRTTALLLACLGTIFSMEAAAQQYYYDSYQISAQHRFQNGAMGGFWGHHLGHMVRTATQGLWYVDDTGTDVNIDPAINYYRFDGTKWILMKTLTNPLTIQQNTATIAVGDSIFTYGVNISGGYIEEAVCDARRNTAAYSPKVRFIGGSTNYLGAAVSPGGTRVVWWTRVVTPTGPSDWDYIYNRGSGWSSTIVSHIPGADFSYVFASFLDDTTFYAGGEVPSGNGPWTFQVGAGKVVIGLPLQAFTIMKGDNTSALGIWVNRANGDVHLITYGAYGGFGYFYRPAGGTWTDTVSLSDNLTGASRCRFIDSPDGNLYLIASQNGFFMEPIPKSSITGKIDFTGRSLIPLGTMEEFTGSAAIFPECPEYQTAAVGGLNFAYPGTDFAYSNLLRSTSVNLNPGTVALRVSMPNGMEVFPGNQRQPIYWYRLPSAGIDTVAIDFSSDGGLNWSLLSAKAPNTGSYNWQVPAINSATCLIRVSKSAGGIPSDTSNTYFTISYAPVILKSPVATITRPTKDTTVLAGKAVTFEGVGVDTDGYIVNYVWKTGDGQSVHGIASTFDHTYALPGVYILTLQVQDNDTLWSKPDSVKITVLPNTGLGNPPGNPLRYDLLPNYPNPFNPATVISYSIDRTMHVRLKIFGIKGDEVARLVDQVQSPGAYRLVWSAKSMSGQALASGWYVCRLETPDGIRVRKLLLMR
jgi:hypothetical protein